MEAFTNKAHTLFRVVSTTERRGAASATCNGSVGQVRIVSAATWAHWPPLQTSMWESGCRWTPTHFHRGHNTSFTQKFFQTFAFIVLKDEGGQEGRWVFRHLKKNSINPTEGKRTERASMQDGQPLIETTHVHYRMSLYINPHRITILWTPVFSSLGWRNMHMWWLSGSHLSECQCTSIVSFYLWWMGLESDSWDLHSWERCSGEEFHLITIATQLH